jgi:hypothetical protein
MRRNIGGSLLCSALLACFFAQATVLRAGEEEKLEIFRLKVYCAVTKKWFGLIPHQVERSLPLFKENAKSPILARYDEEASTYRVSRETLEFLQEECRKLVPDERAQLVGRNIDASSTFSLKHALALETGEYISRYFHPAKVKAALSKMNMIKSQRQTYLEYVARAYSDAILKVNHPKNSQVAENLQRFFVQSLGEIDYLVKRLEARFARINSFLQLRKFLRLYNEEVRWSYDQIMAGVQDRAFYPDFARGSEELRELVSQGIMEGLISMSSEGYFLSLGEVWSSGIFQQKMQSNLAMSGSLLDEFNKLMLANKTAGTRMSIYLQNALQQETSASEQADYEKNTVQD